MGRKTASRWPLAEAGLRGWSATALEAFDDSNMD
jgi:hypothetical protein